MAMPHVQVVWSRLVTLVLHAKILGVQQQQNVSGIMLMENIVDDGSHDLVSFWCLTVLKKGTYKVIQI